MLEKVLLAIAISSLVFVGYLMVKAYRPQWFKMEPFRAPASVVHRDPVEPPRTVAPSGPNPPSVRAEPAPPKVAPEATPVDPSDSLHMETPVKDTVTHPELSFGPGPDAAATLASSHSGVASTHSVSTFSPEFAQNGGSFMGSVFANDLQQGDDYATA
jgi:hypothetical protein